MLKSWWSGGVVLRAALDHEAKARVMPGQA
jgi:hypothetical protein